LGQFQRQGIAGRIDRQHARAYCGLVDPVVGIETTGKVCQSVAVFRGTGAPGNPLQDVGVPGAQTERAGASQRAAQEGRVVWR
jgi:hypothetical protein